jgi:2,5-furandicarboxylate decarboxylase 1
MPAADTERFRLRRYVDRLVQMGECEVHDQPIDMVDVAGKLDGNPKAVLFRAAGPERAELCGNVMGSRKRLAMALDTDEQGLLGELNKRLTRPIAPIELPAADAPVQEVVKTGDDADLCSLPAHLQHGEDGAPYISASLDFAKFSNGHTNVGCRRIMLRGPRWAGIDLIAPSDLRAIYMEHAARKEPLPVAYVVGTHPADYMSAMFAIPGVDELEIIGAIRGAPVPTVKCVTNDVHVPADAEYVLEGYLDPRGHIEPEGPYGEYVGYYGIVKRNPLFHLTAITHRKDALFQTATIGGRELGRTDTAQLTAVKTETAVWSSLRFAIREPIAVCATPASGGMYNVRVSMKQRYPGEPRNALAAVFGSMGEAKHVFIFDEDIDVFSDEQCDWAFATRFQGDRDLLTGTGFRTVPLDPSLAGSRTGAKVGFDCTIPFGKHKSLEFSVPEPPVLPQRARKDSVLDVLGDGPASFQDLMAALGSRDGRDVVRELDKLYALDRLGRREDGKYLLKAETT